MENSRDVPQKIKNRTTIRSSNPTCGYLLEKVKNAAALFDLVFKQLSERKKVKVTQLCPTLCDLMDYIVHGILQARILEWVALPFSRGSPQHRNQTQDPHIAAGFFTS